MNRVKDIRLEPIKPSIARQFIKENHYSGKVVNNSILHIGCFLDNALDGVMQFGYPMDRAKIEPLVAGTKRGNMLELNRMAFNDRLPRNSESHCIRIGMRLIKKYAPQVKWIVSFADATQCGDGTIYRASGFKLTGIKHSSNLAKMPWGDVVHKMTFESNPTRPIPELNGQTYFGITGGKYSFKTFCEKIGAEILDGFQIRYIAFIDRTWENRLKVQELPYSEINKIGAGMYLGKKRV